MKRRWIVGCGLPLAAVVALGWFGIRRLLAPKPPVPERFETVSLGTVDIKVTETGTIEPLKKVEIKSKVAGRVARLLVDAGDRVTAGQLLANIDPTEINSQVAQMRAQLEGAKARLEQSRTGVSFQKSQTVTGISQYEQAVRSSQARLRVAEEENQAQPELSAAEIAQAEAAVRSSEDAIKMLKQSTHPQALVQAESQHRDAEASAQNARRNLARQQTLLQKGFVSQQVVDVATAEVAGAEARLDQAKNRLSTIADQNRIELATADSRLAEMRAGMRRAISNRSLISVRRQDLLAARAAVEQAQAQLRSARAAKLQDSMRVDDVAQAKASVDQIKNQLDEVAVRQTDTRLVASMAGMITRRYMEEGELATSGVSSFSSGTPIVQIADLSKMLVRISVNEVDVHKLRAGLPVEITIDGAKGVVFHGRVRKVAPAAVGSGGDQQGQGGQQQQTGGVVRFAVEVVVDAPDDRLKPGMSAKCTIVIERRENVLRLPNQCIRNMKERTEVDVVTSTMVAGKATHSTKATPVAVGLKGDTFTEIKSGTAVGTRVKPGAFTGPPRKGIDMNGEAN